MIFASIKSETNISENYKCVYNVQYFLDFT